MRRFVEDPERFVGRVEGLEQAVANRAAAQTKKAAADNTRIRKPKPSPDRIDQWIPRLYKMGLGREPTAREISIVAEYYENAEDPAEAGKDILWMVLMLPEFQLIR